MKQETVQRLAGRLNDLILGESARMSTIGLAKIKKVESCDEYSFQFERHDAARDEVSHQPIDHLLASSPLRVGSATTSCTKHD